MALYIGLDGGGTKTKCVLVDEEMNVLSEMIGGPSNFLVFGLDKVTQSLFNLITDCAKQADINLSKIDSILLGTAGAGRRADAERLENSFIQKSNESNISINKFAVESDARIALEGAFSGEPGSILIAGTGSIMFGKDSEGNIHRVGGFGRILGDEGSGFHIQNMDRQPSAGLKGIGNGATGPRESQPPLVGGKGWFHVLPADGRG